VVTFRHVIIPHYWGQSGDHLPKLLWQYACVAPGVQEWDRRLMACYGGCHSPEESNEMSQQLQRRASYDSRGHLVNDRAMNGTVRDFACSVLVETWCFSSLFNVTAKIGRPWLVLIRAGGSPFFKFVPARNSFQPWTLHLWCSCFGPWRAKNTTTYSVVNADLLNEACTIRHSMALSRIRLHPFHLSEDSAGFLGYLIFT